MKRDTTGQSRDAAERSAHVTRAAAAAAPAQPSPAPTPFVGPEFGPVRLAVAARLGEEIARLRLALGLRPTT
jgi:hypothetical protein